MKFKVRARNDVVQCSVAVQHQLASSKDHECNFMECYHLQRTISGYLKIPKQPAFSCSFYTPTTNHLHSTSYHHNPNISNSPTNINQSTSITPHLCELSLDHGCMFSDHFFGSSHLWGPINFLGLSDATDERLVVKPPICKICSSN